MISRQDLSIEYGQQADEVAELVASVVRSGRFTLAERVKTFEQAFGHYIGSKFCVGVGSGFDALLLAMKVCGVERDMEVITTPFTAFPTIAAILTLGAKPVFADVSIDTYLIKHAEVQSKITERTRAILPVHLFGNVVDVPQLKSKLGGHLPIIEDAAQAHGSKLGSMKAGALADFGCFSFYPTKNLGGIGDGGAILFSESRNLEPLRQKRMFGMVAKDTFHSTGFNSRLDEIQAAILSFRLEQLDQRNAHRNKIANLYQELLDIDFFVPQILGDEVESNYHIFSVTVPSREIRDALIAFLYENGVQTNVYYPVAHHLQNACKDFGYKLGDFPNAETLSETVISLPMSSYLSPEDVAKVCDSMNKFRVRH